MKVNRADAAVLKKLGVEDLESCAHAYAMFRPLGEKLVGNKQLPDALLILIAASAAGSAPVAPVVEEPPARTSPTPLKMDLGDGVLRTVDDIANAKKKPKADAKKADGAWRKGRLLNYTRTRTVTDEVTGERETFTEVVPARYVKKAKDGRPVILIDGKNVTVAKASVEDAENEPIRREDTESHGPRTFERQKASADVMRAKLNIE